MKRIYKNIFLLFIFFTINIFSSKDAIIAPKKYKPAEMNLEITKVKLKEIEGTINEVKKELYISKKDLTVDTDDILFITEEKNKLRENFNFQKKDILNNKNYVFTYKQHKDNIYLVHSDKEKIKGIYKIKIKTNDDIIDYLNYYFYIINNNFGADNITLTGNLTGNIDKPSSNVQTGGGFINIASDPPPKFLKSEHRLSSNAYIISETANIIEIGFINISNILICKLGQNDDSKNITLTIPNGFVGNICLKISFKNMGDSTLKDGWLIISSYNNQNGFYIKKLKDINFGILQSEALNLATGSIEITNKTSHPYILELKPSIDLKHELQDTNIITATLSFEDNSSSIIKEISTGSNMNIPIHSFINSFPLNSPTGNYFNYFILTATQKKSQGGKF
ncbi:hypothetical protein [Cetobacterium ceti]